MADELFHLYEVVKLGYLEDRLQYSAEDWQLSINDIDAELMIKLVQLAARHDRNNVLRVLRVIRAWSYEDLQFVCELARIQ